MKYFLISLFFIFSTSCSLQTTKGLIEQSSSRKEVINQYFANKEIDYIYKAKINSKGNYFGGILIIKKTNYSTHRVVFTTEFGNKIFDFEFKQNEFKVKYIIDKLDKKIVLNTLKNSFHLLINESNLVQKKYLTDRNTLFQTKQNKKYNYFYIFDENNELQKAVMASKTKEKLIINFYKIEKEIANHITIKNRSFNMNIDLFLINN